MKLEDAAKVNNIANIIKYMQKASKENTLLSCVSIMHLLDDIVKSKDGIGELQMQSLGLITNIDQWEKDVKQNIKNVYKKPQMQTELKRLHRGFEIMYEAWSQNKLKNSHLNDVLNKMADEQLFQLWSHCKSDTKDEKDFVFRITEGYKKELEILKDSWFFGNVKEEFKASLELLDLHIAKAFIKEWDNPEIIDDKIKEMIFRAGKETLFIDLKASRLPEKLNTFILDDIGHHIFSLIANKKIAKLTHLGSKIECIKDSQFAMDNKSAYMDAVIKTLHDWVSDNIDDSAKEQLEHIVEEYFPNLVKNMAEQELFLFRRIGVKSLFDQMRLNKLDDVPTAKLKSFGQDTVHTKLSLIGVVEAQTIDYDTRSLHEDITKKVICDVRQEWQGSDMSTKASCFIQENVLQDLKCLDKTIQKIVYPAAINASMGRFFGLSKAKGPKTKEPEVKAADVVTLPVFSLNN